MTHFICGVVVPKEVFEDGLVEEYIDDVMDKYSENYQIDPYVELEKEEVEKEFENFKINNPNEERDINTWAGDWYGGDLNEEGQLISQFNPDSFYDWYSIGGRWDGILTDNEQKGLSPYEPESKTIENNSIKISELIKKYKEKEDSIVKILEKIETGESDNPYLIYLLVVEGERKGNRDYGWFGTSTDSKEVSEWKKEYLEILENHKDDYLVNLDCHI